MGEPACQPDGSAHVQCDKCGKEFANAQCFQRHKGSICAKFRRCLDCGTIWDYGRYLKGDRDEHKCGEYFCQICKVFHNPERGCFISKISRPPLPPQPPTGEDFPESEEEDDGEDLDEEEEDEEDVDDTSTQVTRRLAKVGRVKSKKKKKDTDYRIM